MSLDSENVTLDFSGNLRRAVALMGSTESAHLSTPPPPPAGLSILQVVLEVVHAVRF
jgi:hypothetical protein